MELTAKAVGRLALTSGTFMTEYVDDLVKRSFEWLQDRNEGRRLAAVSTGKRLVGMKVKKYESFLLFHYVNKKRKERKKNN